MEWQKVINKLDKEMQELQRKMLKVEQEKKEAEAYRRFLGEQFKAAKNNAIAALNPALGLALLLDILKKANIKIEYDDLKDIEKDLKNLYVVIDERLKYIAEAKQNNIKIDEKKEKDLINTLLDLKIDKKKDKSIREILKDLVNKVKENQENKYSNSEVEYE
jgi:hypothetical protein